MSVTIVIPASGGTGAATVPGSGSAGEIELQPDGGLSDVLVDGLDAALAAFEAALT